MTCSCSYNVNEAAFAEIVYEAAVDAQAHVTVVEKRMQGRDHPVLLGVPGNVLPEMLHPSKARVSRRQSAAASARARSRRLARPPAIVRRAAAIFAAADDLGFYNVGTASMRALAQRDLRARIADAWSIARRDWRSPTHSSPTDISR